MKKILAIVIVLFVLLTCRGVWASGYAGGGGVGSSTVATGTEVIVTDSSINNTVNGTTNTLSVAPGVTNNVNLAANGVLTQGMALANSSITNIGLTFCVETAANGGNDTNTGLNQRSPLLTISNAISRTQYASTNNVSETFQSTATNVIGTTFGISSNGSPGSFVSLSWVTTTNSANQILIVPGSLTTAARNRTNIFQLAVALNNNNILSSNKLNAYVATSITLNYTNPPTLLSSVSNDVAANFSFVTNGPATTVMYLGPANIFWGQGTNVEPALTIPPNVNIYGSGPNSVWSNSISSTPLITLSGGNILSDMTIVDPINGAQAISIGTSGWNELRRVTSSSPFDGIVGGTVGISTTILNQCTITSAGDGVTVQGVLYLYDSRLISIGPQNGGADGQGDRGNGMCLNGPTYAWNTSFFAGGNGSNYGVVALGGASTTTGIFANCSMTWSNNLGNFAGAFANYGTVTILESDCQYARTNIGATVGTVLHNTKPAGDVLNITNSPPSSGYLDLRSNDGGTNWAFVTPGLTNGQIGVGSTTNFIAGGMVSGTAFTWPAKNGTIVVNGTCNFVALGSGGILVSNVTLANGIQLGGLANGAATVAGSQAVSGMLPVFAGNTVLVTNNITGAASSASVQSMFGYLTVP